jgi:hypothetical protein
MGTAIHVVRPSRAEPRAALVFKTEGQRSRERVGGPRALLTIAEAAAADLTVTHARLHELVRSSEEVYRKLEL